MNTVAINGLPLCHNKAMGFVISTMPDVCKAPLIPVPLVNMAFAKDLMGGTTSVLSHSGAMNGVVGARFMPSIGDEAGAGGGMISNVFKQQAVFVSCSPDVMMDGKPVTRLTDKMIMNMGNTASMAGYFTTPVAMLAAPLGMMSSPFASPVSRFASPFPAMPASLGAQLPPFAAALAAAPAAPASGSAPSRPAIPAGLGTMIPRFALPFPSLPLAPGMILPRFAAALPASPLSLSTIAPQIAAAQDQAGAAAAAIRRAISQRIAEWARSNGRNVSTAANFALDRQGKWSPAAAAGAAAAAGVGAGFLALGAVPPDRADLSELAGLVIEQGGVPALRFGFVLKFYFKNAHQYAVRQAMIDILADYTALFRPRITHFQPDNSERLRPLAGVDALALFRARAEALQDGSGALAAELYGFAGGEERPGPTPYHIGLFAAAVADCSRLGHPDNASGWIEAYCPLDWCAGSYLPLIQLVRRWAEIARPIHALAGPGLVMEEGRDRMAAMGAAYPFLARFDGLEFPDKGLWPVQSEDAASPVMRSINWLTVIDSARLKALGGIAAIRPQLGSDCALTPLSDGLLLQAGARPRLGDRNAGQELPAYRAVSLALNPLRFSAFGARGILRGLPPLLDDREQTLHWLARFEA